MSKKREHPTKRCPGCKLKLDRFKDFGSRVDHKGVKYARSRCRKCEVSRSLHEHSSHPEKFSARQRVGVAIERGELVRPERCTRCGSAGKIQGHHPDYAKPLEVIWLCRLCHAREHRPPKPKPRKAKPEVKRCTVCGIAIDDRNFSYYVKNGMIYPCSKCKKCRSLSEQDRRLSSILCPRTG